MLALLALGMIALAPAGLIAVRAVASAIGEGSDGAAMLADGDGDEESSSGLPGVPTLAGSAKQRAAARAASTGAWAPWHRASGWGPGGADARGADLAAKGGTNRDGEDGLAQRSDPRADHSADSGMPEPGHAHAQHQHQPPGSAMLSGLPGRAAPAAPPERGSVHVDWDYSTGGQIYHCTTTLDIADGDGLRRPTQITTRDDSGRLLVSYPGTAFLDSSGALHVDARGSQVSGPWASRWSPDSFAVDEYGQVRTLDDYNRPGGGWATPAGS